MAGAPNVNSVRSLPAQIARGIRSRGLPQRNEERILRDQRRSPPEAPEAIRHLRRSEPALAAAAAERRFRAGQKNSTFPWSNAAAAVYDARGPSWLASCIAIFGAASPLNLGCHQEARRRRIRDLPRTPAHCSTKRAPMHPTRNGGSISWHSCTKNHQHMTGPGRSGHWLCGALLTGGVRKPPPCVGRRDVKTAGNAPEVGRRRSVPHQCTWLGSARVRLREPPQTPRSTSCWKPVTRDREGRSGIGPDAPHDRGSELRSLLEVARSDRWFKVDSVGAYR